MAKRMKALAESYDKSKRYPLAEATALVKKTAKAKFDETVEIHVHLGIDAKKSEQTVRGTVVLPHGTGQSKKVAVIAKGEKVKEAQAAGADFIGDADLIEQIQKGWLDFDIMVATPDTMKDLTKVAKILGPRGLMPNPKSGTVTFDVERTVKELKAGRVEFKADAYGIIHSILGKASFAEDKLAQNAQAILDAVMAAKPAASKGQYIKSVSLACTMGPGIWVQTGDAGKKD